MHIQIVKLTAAESARQNWLYCQGSLGEFAALPGYEKNLHQFFYTSSYSFWNSHVIRVTITIRFLHRHPLNQYNPRQIAA